MSKMVEKGSFGLYIKRILSLKMTLIGIFLVFIGLVLLVMPNIFIGEINSEIEEIMRNIGITLVPIGLLTLIYEYIIRKDFFELVKYEIEAIMAKKVVHETRNGFNLLELIKNAKKKVDILDTSLKSFTDFIEDIEEKLEEGCNFRFLALNPGSCLAEYREKDLGSGPEQFIDEIKKSITDLCYFKQKMGTKKYKGEIEIRKYDSTPTCVLIIIDDEILIGSLLQKRRSRISPHIEITQKIEESIYQQFCGHFDDIWDDERTKSPCI